MVGALAVDGLRLRLEESEIYIPGVTTQRLVML